MGVYFGIPLQKTGPKFWRYRASLGMQPIFILENAFPECEEFWGWHDDLSIEFVSDRKTHTFADYLPTPPPKLVHRKTDDIYLVLAQYKRGEHDRSFVTRPQDRWPEVIRSYNDVRFGQDTIYKVMVIKAKKDDMYRLEESFVIRPYAGSFVIRPYAESFAIRPYAESLHITTLYMVSEEGVKMFTAETDEDLYGLVLGDETISLSETENYFLTHTGLYDWGLIYD